MKTVESFILGLDGQQKAIVSFLHQRLSLHHDLIAKISYNIPMYYKRKWVCYLNPIKNDGIELAFIKGHRLSNDQGLLVSKGRKRISGIELHDIQSIPLRSIDEIVQEALIIDQLHSI
ncbi:DUF1801 domain-containing protein [Ekhidna sp. To15]|uniref:DUF1801 domain-containing protein n=1 Tax=Ekhidna sp. To15 TaxID=3395267 RepID=UPI003F51EF0C